MRRRAGQLGNEPAVLFARLKHQRRPGTAARLQVQNHADARRQIRMIGHKPRRAEQAGLFAIGEEHDQIVGQRRTGAQGSHRFKNRDHARAIVARPRALRHRIVMRHQHDRAAVRAARESAHDVLRAARPNDSSVREQSDRILDLHLRPETAQRFDQIIAHLRIRLRSDGMRARREVLQMQHRSRRRELIRRRLDPQRGRRSRLEDGERGDADQRDHQDEACCAIR